MKRFCWLMLVPLVMFAQNIPELKQKISEGSADSVKNLLPALIVQYPDNPELLYLSGLVETDGEAALLIYRDVLSRYPHSTVADDAFLKIIEYLFTRGLYAKSDKYARELIKTYPRSDLIDRAVYLQLCSLNAMNRRDSVDYYYQYYSARYPTLDFNFENYRSASKLTLAEASSGQSSAKPASQIPLPREKSTVKKSTTGDYMLQMGVFSNLTNANILKKTLEQLGHPVTLNKVEKSGRTLIVVLIGSYLSEDEARVVGNTLKRAHNLDFIVVRK